MKISSVIKYVFPIVGLALFVASFQFYKHSSQFLDNALTVPGIVVDHEALHGDKGIVYQAVVEFAGKNGEIHRLLSKVASMPAPYDLGEYVEVLHSRGSTQDARIKTFAELWGATTAMLIMGGFFFLVGAGTGSRSIVKRRQSIELKRSGVRVAADFQAVKCNRRFSFNDQHPFAVVCQWQNPETGQQHIFTSEQVWFDPERFINRNTIDVYIEQGNPQKYYVDISFLPR